MLTSHVATTRYLFMQIPSNMLISSQKVRPSLYMSACMAAWATAASLMAAVHDYKGLVLARFFLGMLEAPFYPGASKLLDPYHCFNYCANTH